MILDHSQWFCMIIFQYALAYVNEHVHSPLRAVHLQYLLENSKTGVMIYEHPMPLDATVQDSWKQQDWARYRYMGQRSYQGFLCKWAYICGLAYQIAVYDRTLTTLEMIFTGKYWKLQNEFPESNFCRNWRHEIINILQNASYISLKRNSCAISTTNVLNKSRKVLSLRAENNYEYTTSKSQNWISYLVFPSFHTKITFLRRRNRPGPRSSQRHGNWAKILEISLGNWKFKRTWVSTVCLQTTWTLNSYLLYLHWRPVENIMSHLRLKAKAQMVHIGVHCTHHELHSGADTFQEMQK